MEIDFNKSQLLISEDNATIILTNGVHEQKT